MMMGHLSFCIWWVIFFWMFEFDEYDFKGGYQPVHKYYLGTMVK
jgi:hypothetical protein